MENRISIVISAKDEASRVFEQFAGKLKDTQASFTALGIGAGAIAGAVGYMGLQALKGASALEAGMANVASIVDTSRVSIQAMTDQIIKLSYEIPQSTDLLTDGLYQVVSANVPATEAMEFLGVAAKAATAGLATTQSAVEGIVGVLKAYGMAWSEAEVISDKMFVTVKRGMTTFPELAAHIGRVTPLAAQLNVSVDELMAGFATLTGVTGDTAEVSTQLAAILRGMIKPTTEMSETIWELGYSTVKSMLEAEGFAGALTKLISKTDGTETGVAKLLGRAEALNAVFALSGTQAEAYALNLDEITKSTGATEAAFQKQMAAFTNQFAIFKNMISGLGKSIAMEFLPQLSEILQSLMGVAKGFGEMGREQKVLVGGIAIAITAIGGLVAGLTALGWMLPSIIGGAKALGVALTWLATTPIGLVIAALGALVGYYATAYLSAQSRIKQADDEIKATQILANRYNDLVLTMQQIEKGTEEYATAERELRGVIIELGKALPELRGRLDNVAIGQALVKEATEAHTKSLAAQKGEIAGSLDTIKGVANVLVGLGKVSGAVLLGFFEIVKFIVVEIKNVVDVITTIVWDKLKNIVNLITGVGRQLVDMWELGVIDYFKARGGTLTGIFADIFKDINENSLEKAQKNISADLDEIMNAGKNMEKAFKNLGDVLGEGLYDIGKGFGVAKGELKEPMVLSVERKTKVTQTAEVTETKKEVAEKVAVVTKTEEELKAIQEKLEAEANAAIESKRIAYEAAKSRLEVERKTKEEILKLTEKERKDLLEISRQVAYGEGAYKGLETTTKLKYEIKYNQDIIELGDRTIDELAKDRLEIIKQEEETAIALRVIGNETGLEQRRQRRDVLKAMIEGEEQWVGISKGLMQELKAEHSKVCRDIVEEEKGKTSELIEEEFRLAQMRYTLAVERKSGAETAAKELLDIAAKMAKGEGQYAVLGKEKQLEMEIFIASFTEKLREEEEARIEKHLSEIVKMTGDYGRDIITNERLTKDAKLILLKEKIDAAREAGAAEIEITRATVEAIIAINEQEIKTRKKQLEELRDNHRLTIDEQLAKTEEYMGYLEEAGMDAIDRETLKNETLIELLEEYLGRILELEEISIGDRGMLIEELIEKVRGAGIKEADMEGVVTEKVKGFNKERKDSASEMHKAIASEFNAGLKGMLINGESFSSTMNSFFKNMKNRFLSYIADMITEWLFFTVLTGGTGGFFGGFLGKIFQTRPGEWKEVPGNANEGMLAIVHGGELIGRPVEGVSKELVKNQPMEYFASNMAAFLGRAPSFQAAAGEWRRVPGQPWEEQIAIVHGDELIGRMGEARAVAGATGGVGELNNIENTYNVNLTFSGIFPTDPDYYDTLVREKILPAMVEISENQNRAIL